VWVRKVGLVSTDTSPEAREELAIVVTVAWLVLLGAIDKVINILCA
jgi:hypothetical protein